MQRRQTISKCEETSKILTNGFKAKMQRIYNIYLPDIREAIEYYQILSLQDKRRFTNSWKELDRLIGKEPKGSKTYSYKFINEVVAGKLYDEWSNETKEKARNFAQSIIYQRMEQFSDSKTDAEMYEQCKDVIDLTFREFNNFQKEEVVGTDKVLQDMLRHFINSEIPRIRVELKRKASKLNFDLFPSHPEKPRKNGLKNSIVQDKHEPSYLNSSMELQNRCEQNESQEEPVYSCLFEQSYLFEEDGNLTQSLTVFSSKEFQLFDERGIRNEKVNETAYSLQ
ncbi:Hypothetical_protein [Hexamita inflata]|uniref:Hypothetical_protein n=1 Tax=Hexamita inflata TaxID=28002 RepID=A0ABP1I9V3_9EUKA